MKRNLKALGLSLVAVLALSAVAASSAQALNKHHVTVPTVPAIITGHDEEGAAQPAFKITAGEAEVTCEKGTYDATITEKTNTSITVTPTYEGCTAKNPKGSFPAVVEVNHCAYVLENETNAKGDAGIEIECAEGNEITIKVNVGFDITCNIHVTPGTYTGVHYTQTTNATTGKKDITIKATVEGIKYHETHDNFACPAEKTGVDGTLEGGITAEAFKDNNGAGCEQAASGTARTTPPSHTTTTGCEGEVIDLELNENVT